MHHHVWLLPFLMWSKILFLLLLHWMYYLCFSAVFGIFFFFSFFFFTGTLPSALLCPFLFIWQWDYWPWILKIFNQSPWKHFCPLFLCSGGPAARVPAPSASPQSLWNLFHLFHLFFSSVLHSGHFLNLNPCLYLLSPFLSCDGSALTIIKDHLNLYFRSYICFNSRHVLVWILAHLDMYFFLII